ncbi:hypothetical protein MJO28_001746 [Puccinia striiformis f. sp. tritici]|uniref:Uncharacterized protein n=1 Tax=Puccinia striiformis f. sp. tritici TaxID=168172 RepID=A0ACC0EV87_9BASI|nr:hypothetical protein MJO28_001746 [Puccinia striiformis f. sp. tritici]
MANEMTLKEQLANIPKLIGDDNYPMWHKRMRAFLRHKELFDVVTNDPGPNPAARVKKQLSEAANILVNKIDDKLCTSIVTDDNDNNGYIIWTRILDIHARRTGLRLNRALSTLHKIRYEGSLSDFLDQIQASLSSLASIAYVQNPEDICGIITAKLSDDWSSLADPIMTNKVLMRDPVLLINKLRDIAYNEKIRRKANYSDRTATAMTSNTRGTRPQRGCKTGTHNPQNTSHTPDRCWGLHPEQRPVRGLPKETPSHHQTNALLPPSTSQHEQPAFASITTALCFASNSVIPPAVLDSALVTTRLI